MKYYGEQWPQKQIIQYKKLIVINVQYAKLRPHRDTNPRTV